MIGTLMLRWVTAKGHMHLLTQEACAFTYPFVSQNTGLYNPLVSVCYAPFCAQSAEDMGLLQFSAKEFFSASCENTHL